MNILKFATNKYEDDSEYSFDFSDYILLVIKNNLLIL
jgi:hypothetical protein